MKLSRGQIVVGYVIQELVFEGGMVTIYRVQHLKLGTLHAMKILQAKYNDVPAIRREWLTQMHQLAELRHHNLVCISDVLSKVGMSGIIMDWMDGETLQDHLRRVGGVDTESAVNWARELLSALAPLHERNLCHLEINPANVFLEEGQKGGKQANLMDYGIGRRVASPRVQPAFSAHSVLYLSPELATSPEQAGPRSDIYGVGLLLYEMLSGACPFGGETEYKTINSIVSDSYPMLHQVSPHIGQPLSMAVFKAMAREPNSRFTSVEAFSEALALVMQRPMIEQQEDVADAEGGVWEVEDVEAGANIGSGEMDGVVDIVAEGGHRTFPSSSGQSRSPPIPSRSVPASSGRPTAPPDWKHAVNRDVVDVLETSRSPRRKYAILPGILFTIIASFVYYSFFRGRDVRFELAELPEWGKNSMELDGRVVTSLEQSMLELGEHRMILSGGIFEGGECMRCCWESSSDFSVDLGLSAQSVSVGLDGGDGSPPRCPSEEVHYEFSLAPSGRFLMGSERNDVRRKDDELQHEIELTRSFLVGQTEITQDLYTQVMGENPALNKGEGLPVEQVSWLDGVNFCNRMSELEGLELCYQIDGSTVTWEAGVSCGGYRLPTEAEWEYAASAGGDSDSSYSGGVIVDKVAWHAENSNGKSHTSRERKANSWGLHDMSGNLHEWVWDIYGPYETRIVKDPKGRLTGPYRVLRGGSWYHLDRKARVTTRDKASAKLKTPYIGFRIVRSTDE
jgi:formylglycine-generating enzyme required for sulfatase activity/serine/threonine protein kinase